MATTITNVTELQAMKDNLSEDYILGNDIDASATSGWNGGLGFEPVGTEASPFIGSLDGKGYTISGLFIDRSTTVAIGLFGAFENGADISNLSLTSANMTGSGTSGAGVLVGRSDDTGSPGMVCDNVNVAGSISGFAAGGLIGLAYGNNYITSCSSSVTVTSTTTSGGFIGGLEGAYSYIRDSYATGDSSSTGGGHVGGFVATISTGTIERCYATGDCQLVTPYNSSHHRVGGFCGVKSNTGQIIDCYARGDADASAPNLNTGANKSLNVGGFIGATGGAYEHIVNSYSTGVPTVSNIGTLTPGIGGFCGNKVGTITDCFWDTTTSGKAESDGGTGYPTATMKLLPTFYNASWDIATTATDRNDGYPFLSWEINESDTIWLIYGEVGTWGFTFPDLLDDKGRWVKNARVRAYRADIHTFVEEQTTDANGSTTFTTLPIGQDITFYATWGGIAQPKKERWFFLQVYDVDAGGTGAGTVTAALSNIGLGTEDSPQFTALNIGHASDTTLTRVAAGRIAVEGVNIVRSAGTVADNEIVRFSGTTGDLVK